MHTGRRAYGKGRQPVQAREDLERHHGQDPAEGEKEENSKGRLVTAGSIRRPPGAAVTRRSSRRDQSQQRHGGFFSRQALISAMASMHRATPRHWDALTRSLRMMHERTTVTAGYMDDSTAATSSRVNCLASM